MIWNGCVVYTFFAKCCHNKNRPLQDLPDLPHLACYNHLTGKSLCVNIPLNSFQWNIFLNSAVCFSSYGSELKYVETNKKHLRFGRHHQKKKHSWIIIKNNNKKVYCTTYSTIKVIKNYLGKWISTPDDMMARLPYIILLTIYILSGYRRDTVCHTYHSQMFRDSPNWQIQPLSTMMTICSFLLDCFISRTNHSYWIEISVWISRFINVWFQMKRIWVFSTTCSLVGRLTAQNRVFTSGHDSNVSFGNNVP